MANLIPQIAKKNVAKEYWVRVVTAWFLLWTVALMIASVLLFPVFIFTSTQVAVQADSARSAEESVANHEAAISEIEKANDQAKKVIEETRFNRAHQYIELVQSFEGEGVTISQINFSLVTGTAEEIMVAGRAEDRESLAAFRDRLLADERVEEVELPISNLAKDSDIGFNVTVTMVKKVTL